MVNNTQLSKNLADQILAKISNLLIVNKQYNTIYQSSFGEYEIANYKGELLIEFDTQKPGYGVYYGFKIKKETDITDIDISTINKLFAPIMTVTAIAYLSLIGAVLIFCVGVNIVWGKKFNVANMLPAVILAIVAAYLPWNF